MVTISSVSLTDGGWVPESAQWPEVTIDVPVGAIRAIEFVADRPGDWAFHCHKSHHTMNAMGHDVKNFIGVHDSDLGHAISRAAPSAMAMGTGRHGDDGRDGDAAARQHASDDDGYRPFGPIEMGGMFTVMKVRDDLAPGDY